MQGDTAPCGTTDRDAAAPPLLPHAGSNFRSPFSSISSISWFLSTCSLFSVCSVCSVVFSSHAVLFRVFRVFRGFLPHAVLFRVVCVLVVTIRKILKSLL